MRWSAAAWVVETAACTFAKNTSVNGGEHKAAGVQTLADWYGFGVGSCVAAAFGHERCAVGGNRHSRLFHFS